MDVISHLHVYMYNIKHLKIKCYLVHLKRLFNPLESDSGQTIDLPTKSIYLFFFSSFSTLSVLSCSTENFFSGDSSSGFSEKNKKNTKEEQC